MSSPLSDAYKQGTKEYKIASDCYEYGYHHGRTDAIRRVFSKMVQPDTCLFDCTSACGYPIEDCMNCPITKVQV